MTPIGSEPLFANTAPGRISHQKEVGQRRFASVRIFTGLTTWSSGSSTKSSTVGVRQRATTSSQPTTSHSSGLHPYACGYALMSLRRGNGPPNYGAAARLTLRSLRQPALAVVGGQNGMERRHDLSALADGRGNSLDRP